MKVWPCTALILGAWAAPALAMGPPDANGRPGPPCVAPAPALQVVLLWHQHQPRYPKLPGRNVYAQPWVRLHAAKDYVDMALRLAKHPAVHATVNLTPVLLEQLADYEAGATDRHAELAGLDLFGASEALQAEAHQAFFQVSGPMLAERPRLAALKAKPRADYSAQDWLDLQALSNLAWTDPMHAERHPELAPLLAKGQGYSRQEVANLLALHRQLIAEVVPVHRALQEAERLEVSTTPYHHPILPLLVDSELVGEAMPEAPRPSPVLRAPQDAAWHVDEAIRLYRRLFGRAPQGMWPAEGAVAQAVMPLFASRGIRWVATDEGVLARSLKLSLRGEGDRLLRPDLLDRPYAPPGGPAIFFRDRALSDFIGFDAMKKPGAESAAWLVDRLVERARAPRVEPGVLSIILDGENAWEHYPADGDAFLEAFYEGLEQHPSELRVRTPREVLQSVTPEALPRLAAGSWISGNFATWAGEADENQAWSALAQARQALLAEAAKRPAGAPEVAEAWKHLLAAQGSDWFWWYGKDQDSGRDEGFDEAFRKLLRQSYKALGLASPADLASPITGLGLAAQSGLPPQAGAPDLLPKGPISPSLDGRFQRGEWMGSGASFPQGGAMARPGLFSALYFGTNPQRLSLGVEFSEKAGPFLVRLAAEGQPRLPGAVGGRLLATHELRLRPGQALRLRGPQGETPLPGAWGPELLELGLPWQALGLKAGQAVALELLEPNDRAFPQAGPLRLNCPSPADPL